MIWRGRARSRGQALVEFSLVAPLFLAVTLAIAEGGYYVIATSIVNHATHEGARKAVLASTSDRVDVRTRVKDTAAPIISVPDNQITLEWADSNGDGTWASLTACDDTCYDGRDTGDKVKVHTSYTHTPLLGYVFPGMTFPANAEAELLVEGAPLSP